MSSKGSEQTHMPMTGTENFDRPETRNLVTTTMTTQTTVVETPNSYEIVIVQGTRDNWSNRIVYLLSIIGFVVDLGTFFFIRKNYDVKFLLFNRQCLAFSNNVLSKWWKCLSYTLFCFSISFRSSL